MDVVFCFVGEVRGKKIFVVVEVGCYVFWGEVGGNCLVVGFVFVEVGVEDGEVVG